MTTVKLIVKDTEVMLRIKDCFMNDHCFEMFGSIFKISEFSYSIQFHNQIEIKLKLYEIHT